MTSTWLKSSVSVVRGVASGSSGAAGESPPVGPLTNRRTLLQLIAASVAAGGLSGCAEPAVAPLYSEPVGDWREDTDAPFVYATTLDLDGYGRGVLVKVLRVGVDGTDREINAAEYGAAPEGYDFLVIGHESFGRVEAVGPNVRFLRPGDYVVATVRRPGHSLYDAIGLQEAGAGHRPSSCPRGSRGAATGAPNHPGRARLPSCG